MRTFSAASTCSCWRDGCNKPLDKAQSRVLRWLAVRDGRLRRYPFGASAVLHGHTRRHFHARIGKVEERRCSLAPVPSGKERPCGFPRCETCTRSVSRLSVMLNGMVRCAKQTVRNRLTYKRLRCCTACCDRTAPARRAAGLRRRGCQWRPFCATFRCERLSAMGKAQLMVWRAVVTQRDSSVVWRCRVAHPTTTLDAACWVARRDQRP